MQRILGSLTVRGCAIPCDVTVIPPQEGKPGPIKVSVKRAGETEFTEVKCTLEESGFVRVPDAAVRPIV